MMMRIFHLILFALCTVMAIPAVVIAETGKQPPNVLFIAVDDLRTELGCYGKTTVKSPNIDQLASQGVVFEKAYCMVSVCGASRSALMTGIRPKHNRFVGAHIYAMRDAPDAITLNTHFKNHSYTTINNGKVFHFKDDSEDGWSEPAWRPKAPAYALPESRAQIKVVPKNIDGKIVDTNVGPAWECADVEDDYYGDGKTLEKSLIDLQRLSKEEKPFFLAVGFMKPHLPFIAPKKYWDLYKPEDIELPENFEYVPKNAPQQAIHAFGEMRSYAGIPQEGLISPETARSLIHGYYACVSYTDALIGRLLDELDRLGLADNTIVVLWGDHGWMLGEHTMWCKHCVFENAMNAPLIIRLPGQNQPVRVTSPVEFIDIYPSLCELAVLPEPQKDQFQGKSLVPLMEGKTVAEKRYAIGRYITGDTIFDGRYRYSEFRANRGAGQILSRMMYDHLTDPRENVNIVDVPENATVVDELSKELHRVMRLP
jgi:arylsulfatase A-like enzyme